MISLDTPAPADQRQDPASENQAVAVAPDPNPRSTTTRPGFDLGRIARAVEQVLVAIGEDPTRDGLRDTPKRVAKAYRELLGGLLEDPVQHLNRTFVQEHSGLVLVRDIEVRSLCEHHLLPFFGKAHVAYLPSGGRVVGLSKLARVVQGYARRPQVQERLTNQVADALVQRLAPEGVAVIVQADHLCMKLRGVRCDHADTLTTAFRGRFVDDPAMRQEVLTMIQGR